jgi:triosephosphate isomerase (TIM)
MKQSKRHLHLVGNWKMNPNTITDAQLLLKEIMPLAKTLHKNISGTLSLAVPTLFVETLVKQSKGMLDIGTQNIHGEVSGAYTGDISITQAKSVGACFTVLGHSERRVLGETDSDINKKVLVATKSGFMVVLCVGEKVRDESGEYLTEIKSQVSSALAGVDSKYIKNIKVAYEPVWAIGKNATGVATPHESLEVAILIRRTIADLYTDALSKKLVILYGGSANADNANGFINDGGVQGFLLGRASLSKTELESIIKNCS